MRKFLIIASFLLTTLAAKQAAAQSNPLGVLFYNGAGYRTVAQTLNLNIQTDQITGLPGTHSFYDNYLTQTLNMNAGPSSVLIGAAFYFQTPSPLYRLTFSLLGTANLEVLNGNNYAQAYHITLVYNGTTGTPITSPGVSVTIPAGGTAYVPFPAYSPTYTSPNYWVANPTNGFPNLVIIELLPG